MMDWMSVSKKPDVVILGAARTPIGRYGGSLRDTHPAELGARAAIAAMTRAGITPGDIEEVFIGQGRQAGSGPNPARQVAHRAGVPVSAPAQTINQACASGLQTVALAAQAECKILLETPHVCAVRLSMAAFRWPIHRHSHKA